MQRKHNENTFHLLKSYFDEANKDKCELEASRRDVERLLVQFNDAAAERDQLKTQFTGKISITILCFFYVF